MEEINENVEPIKENDQVDIAENETKDDGNMAGLNRTLTSLLAGLIGSALLLFGIYFGAQLLGQSLGVEGQFSIQFLILATLVIFISLLITQTVQMYFYKLVEKDIYTGISSKVYKNFIAQFVLLVLVFPFTFIFLSFSQGAVGLLFGLYAVFSLSLALGIRENADTTRFTGGLLGLFLAAVLSVFMFFGLENIQILIAVITLPIALTLSSAIEAVTEFIVNFVKKV
jgi:hypothetical protein